MTWTEAAASGTPSTSLSRRHADGIRSPGSATAPARRRTPWARRTALVLVVLVLTGTAGAAGGYVGAKEARDSSEARYRQAVAKTDEWKSEASRWRHSVRSSKEQRELSTAEPGVPDAIAGSSRTRSTPRSGTSITRASPSGTRATQSTRLSAHSRPRVCRRCPRHVHLPRELPGHGARHGLDHGLNDFICWETRTCDWHAAVGWENRTSLKDAVFHDAEGCAGYMAVFYSEESRGLLSRHPGHQESRIAIHGTCQDDG